MRRRYRRGRRLDRETPAEELEARLADLRDEMRRIEAELADVRAAEDAAAEGP